MNYVKCINNEGYEGSLSKGKIYRTLATEPSVSPKMIRIIDETYGEPGSESGYLFAADRFQWIDLGKIGNEADESLTVHLPATLKGILYAESIIAQKSMSTLVREWIEEHLDLPDQAMKSAA